MTDQLTDNEVIAAFSGWTRLQTEYDVFFNDQGKPCTLDNWTFHLNHLDFHSNWQRLMPVWYKFRDLKFEDETNSKLHTNYCARIAQHLAYDNLDLCCERLVMGIRWYNSTQNKEQS